MGFSHLIDLLDEMKAWEKVRRIIWVEEKTRTRLKVLASRSRRTIGEVIDALLNRYDDDMKKKPKR